MFEKIPPGKAKQTRFTKAQQKAMAVAPPAEEEQEGEAKQEGDGGESSDAPAEVDAYELAEPVDVLSKIPENFNTDINSAKWKERKEVLDMVLELVKKPKLARGDYGDLVRALKKCMGDSVVFVVINASMIVTCLAQGLRTEFAHYTSIVLGAMIDKFKEKKKNVVDSLIEGIDAMLKVVGVFFSPFPPFWLGR